MTRSGDHLSSSSAKRRILSYSVRFSWRNPGTDTLGTRAFFWRLPLHAPGVSVRNKTNKERPSGSCPATIIELRVLLLLPVRERSGRRFRLEGSDVLKIDVSASNRRRVESCQPEYHLSRMLPCQPYRLLQYRQLECRQPRMCQLCRVGEPHPV